MARITVEDCMTQVQNRFELVLLAAQRAKDIASGAELTVERDNDKNTVVALREIAEATMTVPVLEEAIVQSLQKPSEKDELELLENQDKQEVAAPSALAAETIDAELENEAPSAEEEVAADGLSFAEDNIEVVD